MGNCCPSLFGKSQPKLAVVTLDPKLHGPAVQTGNFNAKGKGTALANAAIHQDRAYFEVTVRRRGTFAVGVCHRLQPDRLDFVLGDARHSWGLRSSQLQHVKEGDVIGCAFDQSDLPSCTYYLNGRRLPTPPVTGAKGLVYPAISVADGAELEVNFGPSHFQFEVPVGFSGVIRAQSVI